MLAPKSGGTGSGRFRLPDRPPHSFLSPKDACAWLDQLESRGVGTQQKHFLENVTNQIDAPPHRCAPIPHAVRRPTRRSIGADGLAATVPSLAKVFIEEVDNNLVHFLTFWHGGVHVCAVP
jgi:hypothetical protein